MNTLQIVFAGYLVDIHVENFISYIKYASSIVNIET